MLPALLLHELALSPASRIQQPASSQPRLVRFMASSVGGAGEARRGGPLVPIISPAGAVTNGPEVIARTK
jgi:hypothetical protein